MTEDMDDIDRLMAERYPPITIIDKKSGQVTTPFDRNEAKRRIAFGAAVETVPTDPERAKKWLADLRERVVAEWQQRQRDIKHMDHERPEPVWADYEKWCAENGARALPAETGTVVRWMLARAADGGMETIFHAPRWASIIADLHHLTEHPPHDLARDAIGRFSRAINFAKAALREITRNIHDIPRLAPAKAVEMFPDGVVPRLYSEIAA